MRFARLFALAVCAALLAAQPAGARPTVSEDYVGTFDPLTFGVCRNSQIPVNLGKVCFDVNAAVDNYVDISGTDLLFGQPGLFYFMRDSAGGCVGDSGDPTEPCPNASFICGDQLNVPIPNGTVRLEVFAVGSLGVISCTVNGGGVPLGAASTGTIAAHFTRTV